MTEFAVLRQVELVSVRRDGRRRLYSIDAEALEPVHRWIASFERFWSDQLDGIQARAEAKRRARTPREKEES